MNRYLMQAIDRLYFRFSPGKIRVQQKPDTYDFSFLTKKEYLENPELFYEKPEKISDFSTNKVVDMHDVEIFNIKFPSPVQTKHVENNTAYGLYFKTIRKRDLRKNYGRH